MAEERVQRRLAAILAVDVVGYSRLMEADEVATHALPKGRRKEVLEPLFERGELEGAAKRFERAAAIRPDDYLSPVLLMPVCRSLGREEERQKWARIAIERAERALNLAQIGEVDRAKEWAARALAVDPDDMVAHYNVACMHAVLGELDPAIDLLEKVLPNSSSAQMRRYQSDSDLDSVRDHPRCS